MSKTSRATVLRQAVIMLAFASLVGFFFFLNYFLYIPRQQANYNQKIFRVLTEVSRDFSATLEGQVVAAQKNKVGKQKDPKSTEPIGPNPSINQIAVKAFRDLDNSADNTKNNKFEYRLKKDSIEIEITDSLGNPLNLDTTLALASILKPNYEHLHKDLFDLLLLVKRREVTIKDKTILKDSLLYRIGSIQSRHGFIHDTLFKDKNYGQFSTINQITIQKQSYLAFSVPFQFRNDELIITGMLAEEKYSNEAARFSKSALITIGALLALVILNLPILKLRISGRKERININEVRILIIVFIVAPFLVVLALGTTLLYQYVDKESDRALQVLEALVEKNITEETSLALDQLNKYDRITADFTPGDTLAKTEGNPPSEDIRNIHLKLKNTTKDTYVPDVIYQPTRYFNLDDIYWANKSGEQIGKWFLLKKEVTYLDISSRNYFKKMASGEAYHFPQTGTPFYIEPTISWATGDYSVNIVTQSSQFLGKETKDTNLHKAILIGMAARMYSIYHPVVVKGYQFAIIKRDGTILFHSETERALHENILEETNYTPKLLNAINRNDSLLIQDIKLYDRDTKMRIKPWRLMPEFYLVTYFEKRGQNLFVFHVAAFTLLGISILLLLLLLFHLGKSLLKENNANRFVRSYPSQWMRPSKSRSKIYAHCLAIFLAISILSLVLLFVTAAINPFRTEAYLFQALYFLPFMITMSYFLVTRNKSLQLKTSKPLFGNWLQYNRALIIYYLCFVALSIILLSSILHDCSNLHLDSYLALLLTLSVPLLGFAQYQQPHAFTLMRNQPYLKKYCTLLGACILLVAVVPTLGMMYYAFRQEYVLNIKSEQLHAAQEIAERRRAINEDLKRNKVDLAQTTAGSKYVHDLKFCASHGIYLPYQKVDPLQKEYSKNSCAYRPDQPPVYLAATRLLLLPQDHEDYFQNNSQHLWLDSAKVILQSANTTDLRNTDSLLISSTHSAQPALTEVAQNPITYLWLLLALIFFALHARTIRSTVKKVFLLDYFDPGHLQKNGTFSSDAYYNRAESDLEKWNKIGVASLPVSSRDVRAIEKSIMNKQPVDGLKFLQLQQFLSPVHDNIWKRLSEDEQLVLYDFALDGFTNFRNSDLIYNLIQKGLIILPDDGHLEVMTHSFRNYLLGKTATSEVKNLEEKFKVNTSWKSLKNVLLAILLAVTIFLFATQRDLTDKMLAIISGLVTLVPLVVKLFDRPASNSNTAQNG